MVTIKQKTPVTDRPLAIKGYISYRYRGTYDWIMIGAKDDDDALQEAQRSTRYPVSSDNLQVYNGTAYVPVRTST